MMGDEIFVDLDHSPPRPFFVLETSLTTNAGYFGIVSASSYKPVQRVFSDAGIGVDHKKIFVKLRINTNDIVDLVEHFQLERVHW